MISFLSSFCLIGISGKLGLFSSFFCLNVISGKLGLSPSNNLNNLSKSAFFPSAVEKDKEKEKEKEKEKDKEKEKEKPEEDENFPSRRSKRMKS